MFTVWRNRAQPDSPECTFQIIFADGPNARHPGRVQWRTFNPAGGRSLGAPQWGAASR